MNNHRGQIITILVMSLLMFASFSSAVPTPDTRQAISVTPGVREHVLTEMRMLLEAVQLVMDAALKQDMETVATSADKVGLKTMAATPQEAVKQLPKEFRAMGRGVHEAMDMIARDARDLGDNQHTLEQLNQALSGCVGCHATYKFQ
ncbi:hypothetical protein [Kaarinaea lacus]